MGPGTWNYAREGPHGDFRISPLVARCYEPGMLDRADDHALPLFRHSSRRGDPLRPEEGLLVAVIAHAVGIFQRYALAPDGGDRLIFADIDAWFASDDTDYPFAFVSICDVLGLDVAHVRSGLRQWRGSQLDALAGKPHLSRLPFRQPAPHRVPHLRVAPAPSAIHPARSTVR